MFIVILCEVNGSELTSFDFRKSIASNVVRISGICVFNLEERRRCN